MSVALVGLFNVVALLLLAVHAAYVLSATAPPARRRWVQAAIGALLVLSPFVLATAGQRGQVAWIARPQWADLNWWLTVEFGSHRTPLLVLAAIAITLVVSRLRHGRAMPVGASRRAVILGGAWAVLPPLLLWAQSQVMTPLWNTHYLLFSLPGLALALAGFVPGLEDDGETGDDAGGVRLGRRRRRRWVGPLTASVVLFAVLGIHQQLAYRNPITGHDEDLPAVAAYLSGHANPGDAVLFVPEELRVLTEVYPDSFTALDDVALARTPLQAANLVGTPVTATTLPGVLLTHRQVWVVHGLYTPPVYPGNLDDESYALLAEHYRATSVVTITDVSITLYTSD